MSDRTIRVRLQAEINSYMAGLKQASSATQQFGREISGVGSTSKADIDKIANASLVMGGIVAAGFAVAVNSAMNFDKEISELGAVSGATGEQLKALRQAALDAGAATAFSASQAAQAQSELAKAGVSTADILGGALTGALDLAAAGGLDLARAAEISANAMTTFGLAGGDVERIADTLAAGANKSAADVDQLGQALSQSGLVADQFGLTMEDSVGTLAAFAQAGLNGSDAGTSFKTMLQRLTPQSQEAADKMTELGIDMFDAAGNFIGIQAAAQELQDSLSGLTQEQRNTALATIFGSDAVRGATILYQEGAEGIGEWISQVDDAGFASDVAAQRLDNLAGDIEALRGSIETALIEGGSRATDALRFLAQSATTTVNGFGELPGVVQITGQSIAGLAGAAGLAVGAVGKLGPMITQGQASLRNAGTAGKLLADNLGKVAGTAAVSGAALGVWAAWEGVLANAREQAAAFGAEIRQSVDIGGATYSELQERIVELSGAQRELADASEESNRGFGRLTNIDFRESMGASEDEIEGLTRDIERISSLAEDLAFQFHISRDEATGFINGQIAAGLDVLGGGYVEVRDAVGDVIATNQALGSVVAGVGADAQSSFGDAEDAAEDAAEAVERYRDALRASFDPFAALFSAQRRQQEAQLGIGRAQQEVTDAQQRLRDLRNDPEASTSDIARAERDVADAVRAVTDAQFDSIEAAADLESAQADLAGQMATGNVQYDDATAALQRWADQGYITQEQADATKDAFFWLGVQADQLHGRNIEMVVDADTSPATQRLVELGLLIDSTYGKVPLYGPAIGPLVPGQQRSITSPYGQVPMTGPAIGPLVPGQKRPPGSASGGYAGQGTWGPTDTIPTWLSPGEFVLNASAASQFSDAELYGMNQGLRPASDGGASQVAAALQGWNGGGFSLHIDQVVGPDTAGQVARGARRVYMAALG